MFAALESAFILTCGRDKPMFSWRGTAGARLGTMALLTMAVILMGSMAVPGSGLAKEAPVVLKFAHCQKTGHPYDIGAQKFAELVAEKTGGKVKVQIYPNSVLGGGVQAVDGVRMGTIDFTAEHTGLYEGYVKELGVLGLLSFYRDWDHFWKVVDGDVGQEFAKKLESHGFKVLGWFRNGWYHVCTRQKVEKPSDLRGLKFRSKPGSAMAVMQDKAFGTVSTSVDYSELYSGFQLGVVDGMVQNVTNLRDTTLYEVTPYICLMGTMYATNPLVVSMKRFQSLPKDIQAALVEAGREACAYERKMSEEAEVRDLEFLKAQPKVVMTSPDRALWDATWKNIESWAYEFYGKDLIERLKNVK